MTQLKKALITSISGQDGSYLAELLMSKGYEVHGLVRRSSSFNTRRLDPIYRDPQKANARLVLHYGDLADGVPLTNLIRDMQPQEICQLGAESHVRVSFDIPEYTAQTTGPGHVASSSEMFGAALPPQNELTAFHTRSPYAAAKVFAYRITVKFREAYALYAANGVLFHQVGCCSLDQRLSPDIGTLRT